MSFPESTARPWGEVVLGALLLGGIVLGITIAVAPTGGHSAFPLILGATSVVAVIVSALQPAVRRPATERLTATGFAGVLLVACLGAARVAAPITFAVVLWAVIVIAAGWLTGVVVRAYLAQLGGREDPASDGARRVLTSWLVLCGLVQVVILALPYHPTPAAGDIGGGAVLLGYAVLGATLVVRHTHAERIRRWRARGATVTSVPPARWILYGGATLALALLVAWLLPSSLVFHGWDMVVQRALLPAAGWLGQPVIALLAHTGSTPVNPPIGNHFPKSPRRSQLPLRAVHHRGLEASLAVLSVWALLAAVLIYVLVAYFRAWRTGMSFRMSLLLPLRRIWVIVQRWLLRSLDIVVDHVPEGVASRSLSVAGRGGKHHDATARVEVIQLYAGVLRRAARYGARRRPAETPLEYQRVHSTRMTGAAPDLAALTAQYIEARYTRNDIEWETVQATRRAAHRVRSALRAGDASPEARGR